MALILTVSVGEQMYHTGMLVLGTITLGGVTFWAMRAEGVSATVKMFKTFKELLDKRTNICWIIIACMSYFSTIRMNSIDSKGQFSKPPWTYGVL
jgi:hypothetical protein